MWILTRIAASKSIRCPCTMPTRIRWQRNYKVCLVAPAHRAPAQLEPIRLQLGKHKGIRPVPHLAALAHPAEEEAQGAAAHCSNARDSIFKTNTIMKMQTL